MGAFSQFNEEYEASIDEEQQREAEHQRRHPTVEQLFMQEALKTLTKRQQEVWELFNYQRLTQEEIGEVLGMTHQGVAKHIAAIETRVKNYVKRNKATYKVLKMEQQESD